MIMIEVIPPRVESVSGYETTCLFRVTSNGEALNIECIASDILSLINHDLDSQLLLHKIAIEGSVVSIDYFPEIASWRDWACAVAEKIKSSIGTIDRCHGEEMRISLVNP